MALIQSLNERLIKNIDIELERENRNVRELVKEVTWAIIREKAELVAEVELGNIDRSVLETEIIKKIDQSLIQTKMLRKELIEKVFDRMFRYGDLQHLIENDDITDIEMPRYDICIVKEKGIRKKLDIRFADEKEFNDWCKFIITKNRGIINENDSHCRVSDPRYRLRINVSIPPRNVTGTSLKIRHHAKNSYTLDDLEREGMFNSEINNFFKKLAISSAKVIIAGKGAAGKTTLLRALINQYPMLESYLACESDTELYPDNPSIIVQKIKKEHEGGRPITLLNLINDGITMTLDGYIIGELIGAEIWPFLNASQTGHKIAATIHSNSAANTFERMITLVKMAGVDLHEDTIRRIISQSVDIIVYLKNFKVAEILEITGYDEQNKCILTNLLYEYSKEAGFIGKGKLRGRLSEQLNSKVEGACLE